MITGMCPFCHKDAPIVHKGISAFCTACGRERSPLANASSVSIAGKPSKLGGRVARLFGWGSLLMGTASALGIGALVQAIFERTYAGYVIGGAIELVAVVVGWAFLGTGKTLVQAGESKQQSTREQAIFALARHRGGVVTAADLAASITVSVEEADRMLTELAKSRHDEVSLEVSDAGDVSYHFRKMDGAHFDSRIGVRVENVDDLLEDAPPASAPKAATRQSF